MHRVIFLNNNLTSFKQKIKKKKPDFKDFFERK